MFGHHKYVPIPIHAYKGKSEKKRKGRNHHSAAYTVFWYELISSCSRTLKYRSIAYRTLHILCFSVVCLLFVYKKQGERERKTQFNHRAKVCKIFAYLFCCLGWTVTATPIMKCSRRGTTAYEFSTKTNTCKDSAVWNNNFPNAAPSHCEHVQFLYTVVVFNFIYIFCS